MTNSLSNLINNLLEGVHRIKGNSDMLIKNVKIVELNISIGAVFLNT